MLRNDTLFQLHFEHLPGPAYIWQHSDPDFTLIAHNRAAASLPFSHVKQIVGKTAAQIQSENYSLHDDLLECLKTNRVRKRKIDLHYGTTGITRPVLVTVVPLSDIHIVMHTEDLGERLQAQQALEASERLYRAIVDNAHEGVWTLDLNCITLYVNRRAAEILGYEPQDMLGRPASQFMFDRDREQAQQIRDRRHAGAREQFDFRFRHKDGSAIWVSAAGAPLEDAEGRVIGSVTMMSDITERIQTERALRESETRLRAILDSHPDTILRVTRDGKFVDAHFNDRHFARSTRTADDFIGHTVADMFAPEFACHHDLMRKQALASGETQLWEYEGIVDDDLSHVEARFTPAGESEVLVTVRNITQRKAVERELAFLAARFEALTEAAFDGVCVSENGHIIEISKRFASMLGYAPDEAIGKHTRELIATPSLATEIDHYLSDRSGPYPAFAYHSNGSVLPIEVCGATVSDRNRKIRIYAIRDIVVRHRLEQEIIDISEREQSRIGRDLHDGVGQTLTGVSLALSILVKKLAKQNPELKQAAEDVTATVQGAIGDIRRIAHTLAPNIIGVGGGGFVRTLRRLADEINRYTTMSCRTEIAADCEIADETVATHLFRIAQEGMHNAIRHSKAKNITLHCSRSGNMLSLEVVDDGVGIPPEPDRNEGTGMKNMRYRSHALNGTFEVYKATEGGTRLVCKCLTRRHWFQET
jgi:PAS domain S-box-containing protein